MRFWISENVSLFVAIPLISSTNSIIGTGFMKCIPINFSGLSMLTHTPSPMNFLNSILKRPFNEKPFILLVVGKPKDDCEIPVYAEKKKAFNKITSIF